MIDQKTGRGGHHGVGSRIAWELTVDDAIHQRSESVSLTERTYALRLLEQKQHLCRDNRGFRIVAGIRRRFPIAQAAWSHPGRARAR
jgi:hypothetical protein